MKNESDIETAFGLFKYEPSPPEPSAFASFHTQTLDWFERMNQRPTHMAVLGKGFSGKYSKLGGAIGNKLIDSGFSAISYIDIASVPPGSKDLYHDKQATIGFMWLPTGYMSLNFIGRSSLIPFGKEAFLETIRLFLNWREWDFGFGLSEESSAAPLFHVICASNGKLPAEEIDAMNRWYASTPEQRLLKPRDIYPINILNPAHLLLGIRGQTLSEYVRQVPGTSLEEIGGLFMWKVPVDAVEDLRKDLGAAGVLIARN